MANMEHGPGLLQSSSPGTCCTMGVPGSDLLGRLGRLGRASDMQRRARRRSARSAGEQQDLCGRMGPGWRAGPVEDAGDVIGSF